MPLSQSLSTAIHKMLNQRSPLHLQIERLPLAVYREIAAHIQQLDSLEVTLLMQESTDFDYLQSQVGGICLNPSPSLKSAEVQVGDRLTEVLDHYASRFGAWQVL